MMRVLSFVILCTQFFVLCTSCIAQTPGEWTWMKGDSVTGVPGVFGTKGVAAPANTPPAIYEAGEWTDLQGNFWIYGGLNSAFGNQGDLWKYDASINMWTWVNGPGTVNAPPVYGVKGVA